MKTIKPKISILHYACLVVGLSLASVTISKEAIDARLEKLSTELEKKRIEHHIPGMAIAIVKDDEIIYSKGFGLSDVEKKTPVTSKSLFPIGSSSKAFTATLAGMLIDENKIQWDDSVVKYLPYYKFPKQADRGEMTIRDLLSHRTGYMRNDLLWINGGVSRKNIMKAATAAEPWAEFREEFHYNNVMYLAAGMATAKQAGISWDQLLDKRILKPLNMVNTTSKHKKALKKAQLTKGYRWLEVQETIEKMPMRNLDSIAPAGAIISNVEDMSQWLRFLLAEGKYQGDTLISAEQIKQTYEPQIEIGGSIHYAMGWFVRNWEGQTVIEHGGNIDGYSAQVAFLPDSNIGYVLLSNLNASPFQQASMHVVWEHLLGREESKQVLTDGSEERFDYDEYIGEYLADFGPFKDTMFTFLLQDGKPAVDVPGQMVYELKDPDEKGKWYFSMTDTISVSFDRNAEGGIISMRMHQNGLDFDLPKKGVPVVKEIAAEKLQHFLGNYASEKLKDDIKVVIKNHRLAVDIPGQMVFELDLPNDQNLRQFRIKSDTSARFITDDNNQITALEIVKNGEKVVEKALRKEGVSEPLPSVDALNKLRKTQQLTQALLKAGGVSMKGTMNMVHVGLKGEVETGFEGEDSYFQHIDLGEYGEIHIAFNKDSGATAGINPYTELKGKYLLQMRREHPYVGLNWGSPYEKIEVVGTQMLGDKKTYIVMLNGQDLPEVTVYVDALTGDTLKWKSALLVEGLGELPVTVEYTDYRDVEGLRLPFKSEITNQMNGTTQIVYENIKTGLSYKPTAFELKKPK